jgi:hypothetical protein
MDRATHSPPNPGTLVAASAVILLTLFLGAFVVAAGTSLTTCGGDGGSPYAAPASPRGQYCDSGLPAFGVGGGLVLAVIGCAVAAKRRRWWPLLASVITAAILITSPLTLGSALSKECADEPPSMTADEFSRYLERRPECGHY